MKILVVMGLGVMSVMAQGPMGPPRPMGPGGPGMGMGRVEMRELKEYLGLSDGQMQQMHELMRRQREDARPKVEEIREKQRQLETMLRGANVDAGAAGRLLVEIEGMRKQLRAGDGEMGREALGVLNEGQRAKLKGLEEAAKLQMMMRQAVGLRLIAPGPEPGVERE